VNQYQAMVSTFNKAVEARPDVNLRVKLIQEEAEEFVEAVKVRNVVDAIDALCDLLYVVYGAADVFEVELDTTKEEQSPATNKVNWPRVYSELDDFNHSVSHVVWAIRSFQNWDAKGKLKNELELLAGGLWECGAEGLGVDLSPFFEEVHRTNMHKLTGPKRDDGKQLKPADWKPPRIEEMYLRLRHGQNLKEEQ
jgi:predicted HAD superfamily Cof-like phosphohydrolase